MSAFLPKISIVTPSYNQGIYIEQTILSVIGQGYENLEYIILDGGSTDSTVEIIKKYEKHTTYWHSKKDDGQTSALNEGLERATGDILCWLCSDDILMPGTLLKIGRMFQSITAPTVVFGNCIHFHQTNLKKVRSSDVVHDHAAYKLSLFNYMIQPSAFWNRSAWEKTGKLNEALNFSMDWEWFIRAENAGVDFIPVGDYLSLFRWHLEHKTSVKGKGNVRDIELGELYKTYNNEKVGNAFIKLKGLRNKNKFFHNIVYASTHYKLFFINKIVHALLFSSISYGEFDSISRM